MPARVGRTSVEVVEGGETGNAQMARTSVEVLEGGETGNARVSRVSVEILEQRIIPELPTDTAGWGIPIGI